MSAEFEVADCKVVVTLDVKFVKQSGSLQDRVLWGGNMHRKVARLVHALEGRIAQLFASRLREIMGTREQAPPQEQARSSGQQSFEDFLKDALKGGSFKF